MARPSKKFAETLHIKAPSGLCSCIHELAARDHTTTAEWTRRALIAGCRMAGVPLSGGLGHTTLAEARTA